MKRSASDSGGAKKAPRVDSGPLAPGPSRRSLSYSMETDPSEDPATIPPEFLTSREDDPPRDSCDTNPSEYSFGTPEEEIPEAVPVAPMAEHYVRPATPVSVTDYSSPLSWPSVNQELPGYLRSSNSDERGDEGQASRFWVDDDE